MLPSRQFRAFYSWLFSPFSQGLQGKWGCYDLAERTSEGAIENELVKIALLCDYHLRQGFSPLWSQVLAGSCTQSWHGSQSTLVPEATGKDRLSLRCQTVTERNKRKQPAQTDSLFKNYSDQGGKPGALWVMVRIHTYVLDYTHDAR